MPVQPPGRLGAKTSLSEGTQGREEGRRCPAQPQRAGSGWVGSEEEQVWALATVTHAGLSPALGFPQPWASLTLMVLCAARAACPKTPSGCHSPLSHPRLSLLVSCPWHCRPLLGPAWEVPWQAEFTYPGTWAGSAGLILQHSHLFNALVFFFFL